MPKIATHEYFTSRSSQFKEQKESNLCLKSFAVLTNKKNILKTVTISKDTFLNFCTVKKKAKKNFNRHIWSKDYWEQKVKINQWLVLFSWNNFITIWIKGIFNPSRVSNRTFFITIKIKVASENKKLMITDCGKISLNVSKLVAI
jgi:hypothetical protein